jgi:O-antigen/teichoic acid export membrane protein
VLRKYLSDIAFMQVLNLLIKPVWLLVIDRAVQNILPQAEYGNYFALFNFSLIFFIVLDLGLNGYNTTQMSRNPTKIQHLAGSIVSLKLLLSVVYVGLVFAVGSVLGYGEVEFKLLLFLCLLQILTSFNQYFRTIVASLQFFKLDGVFMVLDRLIIVVLCVILIWGNIPGISLSISLFVYIQILGVATVLLVLVFFLRKHLEAISFSFRLKTLKPILRKSWPFALLVTLMGLFNYIDSVMLKSIKGNEEAGVYAMGYRLFYALLMFAQIFSGVLLPFFSKHLTDRAVVRKIASYTGRLLLFTGLCVSFFTLAYQKELIEILYPNKISAIAQHTLAILMFGFLGSALVLVYGTLLTAGLELKLLNMAAGFTLLLNLILNLVLIPVYGAVGAAAATVASQVLFGITCWMLASKKFSFPTEILLLLRQFIALLLLFIVIVFSKQYFSSIIVHLTMITLSVLLAAYFFKLYEKKSIRSLTRK